jgi:hypothetical protein
MWFLLASFSNKTVKYIPAAKSAASIGLATRCFANRLQWRYNALET